MALAAPTKIGNSAATESLAAIPTTDSFTYPDSTYVWLEVSNPTAGAITITIESEAPTPDGVQELDKAESIAAGARARFRISQAFVASDDTVEVRASAAGLEGAVYYF